MHCILSLFDCVMITCPLVGLLVLIDSDQKMPLNYTCYAAINIFHQPYLSNLCSYISLIEHKDWFVNVDWKQLQLNSGLESCFLQAFMYFLKLE